MKVLTILKHTINILFIAFVLSSAYTLIYPYLDESYSRIKPVEIFAYESSYVFIHLFVLAFALYYLRKFVIQSSLNEPFDQLSREYIYRSGIFCILFSCIRIIDLFFQLLHYDFGLQSKIELVVFELTHLGSMFFMLFFGLFFIYLSKVLAQSELFLKENQLTI